MPLLVFLFLYYPSYSFSPTCLLGKEISLSRLFLRHLSLQTGFSFQAVIFWLIFSINLLNAYDS
jgi:hypothetical protein